MTAGMVSGDANAACRSSAWVDSALPGNQVRASFCCAPVSFPASGAATATTTSQNSRTTYLIRRCVITSMTALTMTPRCPGAACEPIRRWARVGPNR
jgi:hypothetical protein